MARFESFIQSTLTAFLMIGTLVFGSSFGQVLFARQVRFGLHRDHPALAARVAEVKDPAQNEERHFETDLHFLNVQSFGAVGDGRTLDTKAISRAVRSCSDSGGCTLIFPPGHYVTGTFQLLSNVTLQLDPGAVLMGSANVNDYGYLAHYGFGRTYPINSSGEGVRMGMIIAQNATNVAIVGQGAIDGNGDSFVNRSQPHLIEGFYARFARSPQAFLRATHDTQFGPVEPKDNDEGRPGTLMIFSHCRNVMIRGVVIRNAPNWTIHLAYCKHAVVADVQILNSLLIPNDDGVDCIGSRDVHISDCDIRAGDDDLAVVSSRNVTATNCTLTSHSAAIHLENTRYSIFTNLTILSNRGIGIFHEAGEITKDVLFSNLVIRTRLITGGWWGKAEPIFISANTASKGDDTGYVRNVKFSNILADSEAGILIKGSDESPIQGITLQGIRLHIVAPSPQIAAEVGGNFDLRMVRAPLNAVYKHDIPALYCGYVNDLKIRDFEVSWDDNLPAYFSSAIECQHFHNLQIQDFDGRQAHVEGGAPAISISDGAGISIRDSTAAPGTGTFLAVHNVRKQGLLVGNDLKNSRSPFSGKRFAFTLYGNLLRGR